MNPKYADFEQKNPTTKERIEALTSGILTPDTKAITLWSMEHGRFYTMGELYSTVKEFSGGHLPISKIGVWNYCNGNREYEGMLHQIGAVDNENNSYGKTLAGGDFGDPLVARALMVSRKLKSDYRSMLRIFGQASKRKDASTRRGYVVYKIIKTLASQPDKELRGTDLEELTGLSPDAVTGTLDSLGNAGVIDYESPLRDVKGGKWTGWVQYKLKNAGLLQKSFDEIYDELKKASKSFHRKSILSAILNYIRENPEEVYESNKLSNKLGIGKTEACRVLSSLKPNYLNFNSVFWGGEKQSRAKSNENIILLWKNLIEPIDIIKESLDPNDYKGFCEPLEYYNTHDDKRISDIQNMLETYSSENCRRGRGGNEDVDIILKSVENREFKRSELVEIVNSRREKSISASGVKNRLNKLGIFQRTERGHYRKVL